MQNIEQTVEMRWKVPVETTTKPPVLQYRTLATTHELGGDAILRVWSPWRDVPLVVVDETK